MTASRIRPTLLLSALLLAMSPLAADTAGQGMNPKSGVDLEALDRQTRPQDDFYQFANGGWLDNVEIPPIYNGYTVYHATYEKTEETLKEIIESAAANPGPVGSESQKVGDFYASWMDQDAIDARGVGAIREELDALAGISDASQLPAAMAQMLKLGLGGPMGLSVYPDLRDSGTYAVYAGQSGLSLPNRDYYLQLDNDNFREAREGLTPYVADMLVFAGYDEASAASAAESVYAIEAGLAEAQWDVVRNRDPENIYNPHTPEQQAALGSNLNLPAMLEVLGLPADTTVVVQQPSYFEALDGMLDSHSVDAWKAYLTYRLINSRSRHINEAVKQRAFEFNGRLVRGQEEQLPRWKQGIFLVDDSLGEAVGKIYVSEKFPPRAKEKMEELVENVLATLDDDLDDLAWMGVDTRDKAREKLKKFSAKIGYPDEWRDYSSMSIVRGDHMANIRAASAWEYQRQLSRVGQPVDREEWHMTPQTVNAYYSPTMNEIVFPAARLQPPFFQLDADDAINYGAVGGVIGHEISHGFDDAGSKFDGDGNLVNWWTDADREGFEQRTKVLVEQFNQFSPVEGMHVNGELTLGENIGDLSGVAMAYRAWQRSLDGKEAPVIDGFTGAQRFFIGYAMSRRGKYQEQAVISRLTSDPHSPLKYRVNGPYRNIDAFHEAFDTKPGDGMWLDPEDRVHIW